MYTKMYISYHIISYHIISYHIISYHNHIICIPGSFRYVKCLPFDTAANASKNSVYLKVESHNLHKHPWERITNRAWFGIFWAPKFCSQPRSSLQPICALDPSRPRMLRTVTVPIVVETLATWSKMTQLWLRAKLKLTPKSDQKSWKSCLDSCKDMALHGMLPAQPAEKERKRGLQKRPHEHIMGTYQWLVGDWSR